MWTSSSKAWPRPFRASATNPNESRRSRKCSRTLRKHVRFTTLWLNRAEWVKHRNKKRKIPPERRGAIARGLAGSFFSLLGWWVQHGMKLAPEEMDKMFHSLVWTGVDG